MKDKPTEIAIISDTHLAGKHQKLEELTKFYNTVKKYGITDVLHAGDVTDGVGVYKGQENEVIVWGVDEQADYVIENYPKVKGITTHFICLTPDHEVFIKGRGFISFDKIKTSDEVLSYREGNVIFTKIKDIQILNYDGKIYETTSPIVQMAVTPEHSVFLSPTNIYKKYRYEQAEQAFKRSSFCIAMAGKIDKKDYTISDDEIRILAWFIAEGSWLDEKRGVQIYQNLGAKFNEIIAILRNLKYKYSIYQGKGNGKAIYISKENRKLFDEWCENKLDISLILKRLSSKQLKIFIDEYIKGDGNDRNTFNNKSFTLYTKSKELAEQLAIACIFCGIRTKIHIRTRHIWNKDFTEYELYCYRNNIAQIPKNKFSQFHYTGKVFDLTTEGQNFLVKRNGTIFFTGNCGNHDLRARDKTGIDVGKVIAKGRPDMHYLGRYSERRTIGGYKIDLVHPAGGMAYAVSYLAQKYINNLEGGTKPDILVFGHRHQSLFMVYRNIFVFEAGCFQGSNDFTKRYGINPQIGGWIVQLNKVGEREKEITPKFIKYY